MIVTNFSGKMLVLGVSLFSSVGLKAMDSFISPAVQQRIGIGTLAAATNFVGYATSTAVRESTGTDDATMGFMLGIHASWLTANLHLLRSLCSPKSTITCAKREGVIVATTFATNFISYYLNSKLKGCGAYESTDSKIIRKGLRGTLWTLWGLINIATLYEAIRG